jgi:hypothetical protein
MHDPFFFGYGSLVNRRTHDYPQAAPATVTGWRRVWRHTTRRRVAYLSVAEAPGHEIDGLIAAVPNGDWAALDRRELAYDRLAVAPAAVRHAIPRPLGVHIYRTSPGHEAPPTARHPVLMSYLDTVVQGFLNVFGEDGARRFFATTDGWDAPILDDRGAPRYPRHVDLARAERAFVDTELARIGAEVIEED